MKATTYKKQLQQLLNAVSIEYNCLTLKDKELFDKCAIHSYRVIEPIIASDIELLKTFKEKVKLYID